MNWLAVIKIKFEPMKIKITIGVLLVSVLVVTTAFNQKININQFELMDDTPPFLEGATAWADSVFKTLTHLPPYMGMLFCLGVMWVITEVIHNKKHESEKGLLSVNHALRKIDTPSILFFFGILMSVSSLQYVGVLPKMAQYLNDVMGSINGVAISIGMLSAVFDNVPLVAALQNMYSLQTYPTDHYFWELLAFTAGTGGSCLIIGSAAGVAVMGMEKIDFFWYLKKISWLALIGFLVGAASFMVTRTLF